MLASVILKPKRRQPFYGRHPWVFAGAVERIDGQPADGDEVLLRSSTGNFVARGLFNSRSKIVVRLYSWDESQVIDRDFLHGRLADAVRLRHETLGLDRGPASAYRVCFSEADRLSGLVVDRYGEWLTVQFTGPRARQPSRDRRRPARRTAETAWNLLATEKGIGKLEGCELHDGPLWGEPPPAEHRIEENGLTFAVNLAEGQKTGYYLDQRDNRAAVARLCVGKRVLDAFSYSGGFGVQAAKAGARACDCVDASEAASRSPGGTRS